MKPVSEYQIYQSVAAYKKVYPSFTKLIVFDSPISQRIAGFEQNGQSNVHSKKSSGGSSDSLDSLRRTKTSISDVTLCNEFQLFCTFTFAKDRQDVDKCKRKMSDWLKSQQKLRGSFDYLIVPEFHKDGQSIHFHALIKNYRGSLVDSGKKIGGRTAFNLPSYRSGFSTAVKIDNQEKVSSYVRKYITKAMPTFQGKKRYWVSNNLKRPLTIALNTTDIHRENGYKLTYQTTGLTLYRKETTIKPPTNKERSTNEPNQNEHRRNDRRDQHNSSHIQKKQQTIFGLRDYIRERRNDPPIPCRSFRDSHGSPRD